MLVRANIIESSYNRYTVRSGKDGYWCIHRWRLVIFLQLQNRLRGPGYLDVFSEDGSQHLSEVPLDLDVKI